TREGRVLMNLVRQGRIATLPFALREEINRKLRDNITGKHLIKWLFQEHGETLKAGGIKELTPKNVSTWRIGGYKDWLHRQLRLEEMRIQRELAFEIAQKDDG